MRAAILGALILIPLSAGAFAVLPQQMKEELNKAFKKEDQVQAPETPPVPAPDLDAMLASAKKAQENLAKELKEEAERKAREAEAAARRRKMIAAGAVAALVLVAVLKRLS